MMLMNRLGHSAPGRSQDEGEGAGQWTAGLVWDALAHRGGARQKRDVPKAL